MDFAASRQEGQDYLVASVIATEVPPRPMISAKTTQQFTEPMIDFAIAAVSGVIRNRVASVEFPDTPVEVVLGIRQFSAVLRGLTLSQVGHRDIWPEAVGGSWFPDHVARCLKVWQNRVSSPAGVGGATHYYSPVSMLPFGRRPGWAALMAEVPVPRLAVDYFRFYK